MIKLQDIPLPLEEERNIIAAFQSSAKAYGQISTLHQDLIYPRTVHFHYHPQSHVFFINTHTHSRKYQAAKTQAMMAGCYWNVQQSIQYTWHAALHTLDSLDPKNFSFTQDQLWQLMREEVRLAYYLDEDKIDLKSKDVKNTYPLHIPPPNHGVLVYRPHYWDVFYVSQQEHRLSERKLYSWQPSGWTKENVSILHTP